MNTNTSVSIVQPGLAETLLRGAGEAALLTLSAAVPLAVGFSLNDSFDLPKMTIVAFGAIFVAAVAAVRALSAGKLIWRSTPLDVPLVGLLAVSLVAALLSIHRPISFFGQYREYAFGWLPLLAV
ncbi:MAG TPA: hypothetical protein P5079_10460, partial [Elusimicrobiota bacterium]|nr:hypothetical protein [Elusimicrobiota bacterium]